MYKTSAVESNWKTARSVMVETGIGNCLEAGEWPEPKGLGNGGFLCREERKEGESILPSQ